MGGAPYQRLAAHLWSLIQSGDWPPGYRIPSHAQLQAEYHVGRGVVEYAVQQLRREGLLEGVRRGRPYVAYPPAVRTLVDPDADWPAPPRDARQTESRPRADEDLAARLGIEPGVRVTCRSVELVDASGVTVGLCTTWRHGRRRGHASYRCEVLPHQVTAVEAELTGLTAGASAFLLQRVRYAADGCPVEACDLVLPMDRWRLGCGPHRGQRQER
ncbi:GntR family transcriptional regulator [Streptomyces antimycoticus]|uniref:GntR family transcriptional regulator n=1 Tax=Streptomyces antimycoticus TaxID=68175 RepID=UPI0036E4D000